MSSGKQLSFSFGEVSPSLRFRANVSFYSQALSLLLNGYVRKSGGVSNRPGTLFISKPSHQSSIPTATTEVGVRLFPFTAEDGTNYVFQLRDTIEVVNGVGTPLVVIAEDGTESDMVADPLSTVSPSIVNLSLTDVDLSSASITTLGNSAIINYETISDGSVLPLYFPEGLRIPAHLVVRLDAGVFYYNTQIEESVAIGTAAAFTKGTSYGIAPTNIPVSYLVLQEHTDGSEVQWQQQDFADGHPHSGLSTTLVLDAQSGEGIKQYNIYRAAGPAAHYSLVGRIPPSSAGAEFRDYLVSPDITVQPPTDDSMILSVANMRKMVYYKERAIAVFARDILNPVTPRRIEGQVGVSKLGAPKMFRRPLTPNNVDAFSFTIPSDKLSRITNALVMNRLILFTKDNTFSIRGGEGGVLTPQTINPEHIYGEGCTPHVSPVAVGSRGFYISYDKSKLLAIKFSQDDSSAAAVGDVSTLSDHLFEKRDIRRLAIVNAGDNVLWILKKDGTLISLTISEEGSVQGYARHDTDGFIEDICVQYTEARLYPADYDTQKIPMLYMSVIREGVRYYERMAVRDDIDQDRYLYADAAVVFGDKFQDETDETNMHINISADQDTITDDLPTGDFSAGQVLTLTDMADLGEFSADWEGRVYDFFYGTDFTSSVRLYIDTYVDPITLLAHCEQDIPVALQDINVQDETEDGVPLTYEDKLERQMKFLRAFNQITGLTHLAEKDVSVYADGIIVASPNNPTKTVLTVDVNGVLDLPTYYNRGYVGLPYTMEMETLNIEASDDRTLMDSGKLINKVGIALRNTIGGYIGQTGTTDLENMEEIRNNSGESTLSGYDSFNIPSHWEQTGKILIKQVDPAPMTVLAVFPKGVAGDGD